MIKTKCSNHSKFTRKKKKNFGLITSPCLHICYLSFMFMLLVLLPCKPSQICFKGKLHEKNIKNISEIISRNLDLLLMWRPWNIPWEVCGHRPNSEDSITTLALCPEMQGFGHWRMCLSPAPLPASRQGRKPELSLRDPTTAPGADYLFTGAVSLLSTQSPPLHLAALPDEVWSLPLLLAHPHAGLSPTPHLSFLTSYSCLS